MKSASVFIASLFIAVCILAGCTTPMTITKTYSEEVGPDGKKTIIQSESVVQVKHSSKDFELEHIK
jgi:hypothetical protein